MTQPILDNSGNRNKQSEQARSATIDPAISDAELRQRRDAMYTPLEEAVEVLQVRRKLFGDRTPGRDWLPQDLPAHPKGYAILSRCIATPNYETRLFLESIKQIELPSVILGFAHDKYVTENPIKRALGRLGFFNGYNRHGHHLVEYMNILNGNQHGHSLSELQTYWGQDLMAFHRDLMTLALRVHRLPKTTDTSEQYARAGGTAFHYYREFLLKLCIGDGLLFEDFLLVNPYEHPFTRDVVLPAFDSVTAEFGMKPLIVRLIKDCKIKGT